MNIVVNLILLLLFSCIWIDGLASQVQSSDSPNKCPEIPKLDTVPGGGWCNLRNIPMAQVFCTTYNLCKTTLDGKFLIPDHVSVVPIRESSVILSSEIIDTITNYTSVTSKSININTGLKGETFKVSGGFEADFQDSKQKMVDDKSIMTRVSGTYTLYVVQMPSSSTTEIEPDLKVRLVKVINAIQGNQTQLAQLLLELIVRDYGTHLINSVTVGGILLKEDWITRKYAEENAYQQNVFKASASASYLDVFNFDASYKSTASKSSSNKYSRETTFSKVRTFGGMFYNSNGSDTVSRWLDSLTHSPVAIDRAGVPLYFLITLEAFPDVPLQILVSTRKEFEEAIWDFYNYNTRIGCADPDSLGFDYHVNVAKECAENAKNSVSFSPWTYIHNLSFGGVFQDCISDDSKDGDFCETYNLRTANPVTKGMSCQANFTKIPIISAIIKHEYSDTTNYLFFEETVTYVINSFYTAYWCAAPKPEPNTGALFGGLYTSNMPNPLTQERNCPPTFLDMLILRDLHICVGYDYGLGHKFAVDFGGFYSCVNGNPLYSSEEFKKFRFFQGGSTYVKSCPKGFTQHTAYIFEDCLINYCLATGSFKRHGGIPIVLPPFISMDVLFTNVSQPLLNLEVAEEEKGGGVSGLGIGVIVILSLVGLIILILVVVFAVKWQRKRKDIRQNGEDDVATALLVVNEDTTGYREM